MPALRRAAPLRSRPSVTVVIPNFDYGRYLDGAVASALDQPGVDVDVVVADNGSTDDSVAIARRRAARDGRVRVLEQPRNIPYIENFNAGLAEVTGEYCVVLCSDDLLPRGALTRAVALLEARPGAAFSYGHCPVFDCAPPGPRRRALSWTTWDGAEWIDWLYRSGRNFIRHPEVVMRSSVMREVGGYDPTDPDASDMTLWIAAATRGAVGRVNGAHQGYFRIHGANQHLHLPDGVLSDLRNRRTVFDGAPISGIPGLDAAAAREHAHRALAGHALRFAQAALDVGADGSPAEAAALADFARATWPGITATRGYRLVRARIDGSAGRLPVLAARARGGARTTVATRLKRHLGV